MTSTITKNVFHPFTPSRGHRFTRPISQLLPQQGPSISSSDISIFAEQRGEMREQDRTSRPPKNAVMHFGDIIVDFDRVVVHKAGVLVELTANEFKALKYFAERPGLVISREQFLIEVLGYNAYPTTRTVDNHICKLRHKLEPEPDHPIYFRTVRGIGYRFVGDAAPRAARSIDNGYDPRSHPADAKVSLSNDVQTALLQSLSLLYYHVIHHPRNPPPGGDTFDQPAPTGPLTFPPADIKSSPLLHRK